MKRLSHFRVHENHLQGRRSAVGLESVHLPIRSQALLVMQILRPSGVMVKSELLGQTSFVLILAVHFFHL